MRQIAIMFAVLIAIGASGCAQRFAHTREFIAKPSPWPFYRGEPEAKGAFPQASYNGKLSLVWEDRIGHKVAAPLTIYHGNLVASTTGKRIRFYDTETGVLYGQLRLNATGQTSVLLQDTLLFVALAPNRNRLEAINLNKLTSAWKAPVKDASPAPIILNDRLIISSADGLVYAFELATGRRVWSFKGEGRFTAPMAYADGTVYQPSDKGTLYAINAFTGNELYQVKLEGPLVGGAAVGGIVCVAGMRGQVYGISPTDGAIIWQTKVNGPVWTTPAIDDDLVVIGHSGGEVVALNRLDGSVVWRFPVVEVVKASPLLVGQYVVVGTMSGKLVVLNRVDGSRVAETKAVGAIAFPPVTDGARIYVATQSGRILCYGEPHEQLSQDRQ